MTNILNISCGLVLELMPQDHIEDKSLLVLIMAWCIHATWTNIDQDPWPYKTLLGHNDLKSLKSPEMPLFIEKFAQPKNTDNIKACITGILWVESINPPMDSPHKWSVMCKEFQCHDAITCLSSHPSVISIINLSVTLLRFTPICCQNPHRIDLKLGGYIHNLWACGHVPMNFHPDFHPILI